MRTKKDPDELKKELKVEYLNRKFNESHCDSQREYWQLRLKELQDMQEPTK